MNSVVILPTYNEAGNIQPLVRDIFSVIPDVSVMVVDDNSPDGTADRVAELQSEFPKLELVRRPHRNGLGGAYLDAFRRTITKFDRVITMDADFSHSPRYIPKLLKLSNDAELVVGSRYVVGGGIQAWELWRRLLSRAGNFYVRCILGFDVRDWTSGFTCIDTRLLSKVQLGQIDLSGYAFLQELKYLLIKLGARVKECPIVFEARRNGESKISAFIIREGIAGPWKIRFKK